MSLSSAQVLQAQIIEKAWSDPAFKQQLLADPQAAIKAAFGFEVPADIKLTVVEETDNSYYLVLPSAPKSVNGSGKAQVAMW